MKPQPTLGRQVIWLTFIAHTMVHIYEQAFPPMLKLVGAEYDLSLTMMGGLANIFPFFFGLMGLPAGYFADRYGSRIILLIFLVGSGVAALLVPVALPIWSLAFLFFMMGAFAGMYHPPGLRLISTTVPASGIGRGMGIHGSGGNLGLALGPVLGGALAASLGWRNAYLVLGIPGIIAGLWLLSLRSIRDHEKVVHNSGNNQPDESSSEPGKKNRAPLAVLFLLVAVNGFTYRGFLTFMPTYMSDSFPEFLGLSPSTVGGLLTSGPMLLGIVGQYIGGRLADRFDSAKVYFLFFVLSTPLLFAISALTGFPLIIAVAGFAFVYFANQPVGNKLLATLTDQRRRGLAYGLFFFIGFGLGSFASTISGKVGEIYGINNIFAFLGMVLVLVSVLSLGLVFLVRDKPE